VGTIAEHAYEALAVQNACNLSGVVKSLDHIMSDLWKEAQRGDHGTDWVNTHPIVVAFVDKLASLARCQGAIDPVMKAYEWCENHSVRRQPFNKAGQYVGGKS
jgi:hypothetical protein